MIKKRVLHVLNRLNTGGVERWLVGVTEQLQHSQIEITALLHSAQPGNLEDAFKQAGGQIAVCEYQRNPLSYAWRLYRLLRQQKFDVVHSHVDHFSGWVLFIAWLAGVKGRIAHSHSNREAIEPDRGIRAWYLAIMKRLIRLYATEYVAVSREAQRSQYGNIVAHDDVQIVYCGIQHLNDFNVNEGLKQQLGIAEDALVIGHVGRLSEAKNHAFLLDVFAALNALRPSELVLVGDGELRHDIEQKAAYLGLQNKIHFLGMRDDAVSIMASVFDFMVFPSLFEGLPLTVVEAQVAKVPTLVADHITKEAQFDPSLVRYLSLQDAPEVWAQAILNWHDDRDKIQASVDFKTTDFYMPNHINRLQALYQVD